MGMVEISAKVIFIVFAFFIFVAIVYPSQDSHAFVNNQMASTIIGNFNSSLARSVGQNGTSTSSFDLSGNLWVVDSSNNRILEYRAPFTNGMAASLSLGEPNLSSNKNNNGGISANSLSVPHSIAFDSSGNLWVSDSGNNRVLEYLSPFSEGESASLVIGQTGFVTGTAGTSQTTLFEPTAIKFDSSGNLWVADGANNRVLEYLKGSGFTNGQAASLVLGQGNSFTTGNANQGSSNAGSNTLDFPHDIAFDSSGNLWLTDCANNRVLEYLKGSGFTNGQAASLVLGQGNSFTTNAPNNGGSPSANSLSLPSGLAFDSSGNIWIADSNNNRILEFNVPILSGNNAAIVEGQPSFTTNSSATTSTGLSFPQGLSFDSSGNLWVSDYSNNRLIKYSSTILTSSSQAASLVIGQPNMISGLQDSPGLSASTLNFPQGAQYDATGNLWIADGGNNRVLEFVAPFSSGEAASVVIGQPNFTTNSNVATSTGLHNPQSVAFDSSGNLWVADGANNRVLEYLKGSGFTNGQAASLVLGQGNSFTTNTPNNGGSPSANSLSFPDALKFDPSGNLWVADPANNRVLEFVAPFSSGEAASVVIGQATFTTNGTGLSSTQIASVGDVILDSSGNLWISDPSNNRVLEYLKGSGFTNGQAASLVLGQGNSFTTGNANQGASVNANTLDAPVGLRFDSSGNLWATDYLNNRVLEYLKGSGFTNGQAASLVLGQSTFSTNATNNGGRSPNSIFGPIDLSFDPSDNLMVLDSNNMRALIYSNSLSNPVEYFTAITSGSNVVSDGNFESDFTAQGTWNNNVNFNVQQTDANPHTTNPPGNTVSKFYDISTNAPGILSSRTVVITYNPSSLGSVNVASLVINRFSDGAWSQLSSTVDTIHDTVTATTPGFSTFVISGGISPQITSIVAAGNSGTTFFSGNTITIHFSQPTNQKFGGSQNSITATNFNSLFTCSSSLGNTCTANLGTDFTGTWQDPSTLIITAGSGGGSVAVSNNLVITPISNSGLENADATAPVSANPSPTLTGSFSSPPIPFITSFVANDPNNGVTTFHAGDTLLIRFSEPTNEPGGTGTVNQAEIGNIFQFTPSLGSSTYSGKWVTPSLFNVTINTVDGSNPAIIGTTTVTVIGTGSNSLTSNTIPSSTASTSTSPPLSGSFGTFTVSISVASGGTAVTTLPSGIVAETTIGSNTAQTVTYTKTTAPTTAPVGSPTGSTLQFLGTPVDISLQTGACSSGASCTFSFEFTCDDVNVANVNLPSSQKITFTNGIPNVSVFHDRQHDQTFSDSGDQLPTQVTQLSSCLFLATAQDDHTSKFAVGGVIAALAILGSENNAPAPPTLSGQEFASDEYPLTINGQGFKLDQYTNSVTTSTFQVGKPIDLKLLVYSNLGPDDVEGVALFTNLHGSDLQVSDSNTILTYDNTATTITDPDGFTKSVLISKKSVNDKLQLDFVITFANPMDASNLIIRTWTKENYKEDTQIIDAFRVVNAISNQKTNSTLSDLISTNAPEIDVGKTQSSAADLASIPIWVKNNAKWWADGKINDENFLVGVHYLVKNGIITIPHDKPLGIQSEVIPAWVKNNARFWADGSISDTEFTKGIQYLIDTGIIRPIGNTSHLGVDPLPFR